MEQCGAVFGEVGVMSSGHALPMAIRAAYLALHRRSDASFSALGATADQFVLLATLVDGDVLTQRELARRMTSDPSTVRAMLVLLERKQLVVRDTRPDDARGRTVRISAAGRKLYDRLWEAGEPIRNEILSALTDREARQLVVLLEKVSATLMPKRPQAATPHAFSQGRNRDE